MTLAIDIIEGSNEVHREFLVFYQLHITNKFECFRYKSGRTRYVAVIKTIPYVLLECFSKTLVNCYVYCVKGYIE